MGAAVTAAAVAGVLVAVLSGALAAAGRPPGRLVLVATALLEVVVVFLLVVAVGGIAGGHRLVELLTFWAYLVAIVLVVPLVTAWSLVERTRWSNAVIALGGLTVAAMAARLWQMWQQTRA